jgi:hypothetical protein
VEKAQLDPRTHVELHIPVVGIIVFLGQLLGLDEPLTDLGEDLITTAEKGVYSLRARYP